MPNRRYVFNSLHHSNYNPKFLYLTKSNYGEDWSSNLHSHPFMEIIFITSGKGQLIIDGLNYNVKKGHLAIINPNIIHTEKSDDATPLEYLILGVDNINFLNLDTYKPNDQPNHKIALFDFSNNYNMRNYFDLLLIEIDNQDDYNNISIGYLMNLILIDIIRKTDLVPNYHKLPKISNDCAIVKRFMDSNYSYDLTLDELASKIYVSKYHLIHIFKKNLNVTPIEYLTRLRLNEGKMLLEKTNFNITTICKEIGFSCPTHFTQTFKKVYGVTPTKYRKEYETVAKTDSK